MKKRTLIIIVGVGIVMILAGIFFLLRKNKKENQYPEEIIEMDSIGTTDEEIVLDNETIFSSGDYEYYKVEATNVSIPTFMSNLGIKLIREETGIDNVKRWVKGTSYVSYDLTNNYLQFEFNTPIPSTSDLTSSRGISDWIYENLKLNLACKIDNILQSDSSQYVYANILLEDTIIDFKGRDDKFSLFFILNPQGDIKGGGILLLNIIKEKYVLPLVDYSYLQSVINEEIYPKEVFPDFGSISDTLELSYMSDDWEDIEESLNNCRVTEGEMVYYYSNNEQEYLLPAYKLESFCEITYQEELYTVPATIYTNAVSPEYISAE